MWITLNDSEKLPSKFVHIQLVALSYVSDWRISSLVDTWCMFLTSGIKFPIFVCFFLQNLCQTELLHIAASCATQEGFSQHLSSDNKDLVSTSRLWSIVFSPRRNSCMEPTYRKVAKYRGGSRKFRKRGPSPTTSPPPPRNENFTAYRISVMQSKVTMFRKVELKSIL